MPRVRPARQSPGEDVVIVEHGAARLRFEITDNRIVPADYLYALLLVPGGPDAGRDVLRTR
jgi:hypothetical protein